MAQDLDSKSSSILEFRPRVQYIEPAVLPGQVNAREKTTRTREDVTKKLKKLKALATNVNILATLIQSKADERAKNVVVKLDKKIDASVVAAMQRMHPDANPLEITYAQYKECKERMRKRGEELGRQGLVNVQEVKDIQSRINSDDTLPGDWGTEKGNTGGKDPRYSSPTIIEPIDVVQLQDVLIRILINFVWKNFIKPALPGGAAVQLLLPNEIAPLPPGFQVGDIISGGGIVLGEKPPVVQSTLAPVTEAIQSFTQETFDLKDLE